MSWNRPKSRVESIKTLLTVARACSELGGETSKHLLYLAETDLLSLINYEFDYNCTTDLNDIVYARQIQALFSKSAFIDIKGVDKRAKAVSRFVESEAMCQRTNDYFKYTLLHRPELVPCDVLTAIIAAGSKIGNILGRLPSRESLDFCFGPGANTSVKGSRSNPRSKLSSRLECSSNMSPFVGTFLEEVPLWVDLHHSAQFDDRWITEVDIVPGKLMFVPKNAKTDRSIVIEPILNSFFQKGYGSYIRDRLLRSGVDLRDQSINQDLACRGSVDGTLATVDLSMASDCISVELVKFLLPSTWYDELNSLCTREVTSEDLGALTLQKFSSMGNGFTFELESLIFYGIASAVCEVLGIKHPVISVYGDDIIIPVAAFDLLERTLQACGFSLNREKSFCSGPFRESCGADYLLGFDVRPFYQKDLVSERTLFCMHNWFVRHGEYQLAALTRQLCNPAYILTGPDGFGDGHLIGDFSPRLNRRQKRDGWGGGFFDTYTLKPRSFKRPLPGDFVLPSYSVYTRSGAHSPTDPNVVRGSAGYAKKSIYTLRSSIFGVGF